MKTQSPYQHTNALKLRQNKQRCVTPSCYYDTADVDPFTLHFKQFLPEPSTSQPKQSRPYSVNKTGRTAAPDVVKINSLYRKLLTSSLDKDTIEDNMNRLKMRFETHHNMKDAKAVIFHEYWEEEPKPKIQKSEKKTFESRFETEVKNNKIRSIEIKSFQTFMNAAKKQEKTKYKRKTDYMTVEVGRKQKEMNSLSISGNHKQINSKYWTQNNQKNQPNKLRMLKTHKTPAPVPETSLNPTKAAPEQKESPIHGESQEQKKVLNSGSREEDIKTTKTTVNERQEQKKSNRKPEETIRVSSIEKRYKNFFSPHNGIQIQYASGENQDSFSNIKRFAYKRSAVTTRPIQPSLRRPIFKHPQVQTPKGIVFRSKSTCQQYQPCIDGWNIGQEQPQQFNDLFSGQ